MDDPVELVRVTLQGYGNSLTPEKLEAALKGTVIAADKWKNWWDKVRAMLRSNVQFMMPTRKGERITLRTNILSRAQAALEDYNKAADLKAKVRVLDGIKMETVMTEPDAVNALVQAVDADVRNGGSLALQQVLELAVLRDDLIAAVKTRKRPRPPTPSAPSWKPISAMWNASRKCSIPCPPCARSACTLRCPPSLEKSGRRRRWSCLTRAVPAPWERLPSS